MSLSRNKYKLNKENKNESIEKMKINIMKRNESINTINTSMIQFLINITERGKILQKEISKFNKTLLSLKYPNRIKFSNKYNPNHSVRLPSIIKNQSYNSSYNSSKLLNSTINILPKDTNKEFIDQNNKNICIPKNIFNFGGNIYFHENTLKTSNSAQNIFPHTSLNSNNYKEIKKTEKDIIKKLTKISDATHKTSNFTEEDSGGLPLIPNETITNENSNIVLINENSKRENLINEDGEDIISGTPKVMNSSRKKIISYRTKNYIVDIIPSWEVSTGLRVSNLNEKDFLGNKEQQKTLISNQIEIILENINYFKLVYLNILSVYIKNDCINKKFMIRLNKTLEETSALFMEIGNLIIKDFESFLYIKEKLVSCYPRKMEQNKRVINENSEFFENMKILNECIKFLEITYDIYSTLVTQVDNYKLPMKKIIKVKHFLCRARYNINLITANSKKFIEVIRYEDGIINLFNEQQKYIDNNEKLKYTQYANCNNFENQERNNKRKSNSSEYIKDRRLRNVLNSLNKSNSYFSSKKDHTGKHINFEDRMFLKISQYMIPNVKKQFQGYCAVLENKGLYKKKEREVYKFDF